MGPRMTENNGGGVIGGGGYRLGGGASKKGSWPAFYFLVVWHTFFQTSVSWATTFI